MADREANPAASRPLGKIGYVTASLSILVCSFAPIHTHNPSPLTPHPFNKIKAWPHVKAAGQAFVDHLKEQEPQVLAGYAFFVVLVVGLLLLRRYVPGPLGAIESSPDRPNLGGC